MKGRRRGGRKEWGRVVCFCFHWAYRVWLPVSRTECRPVGEPFPTVFFLLFVWHVAGRRQDLQTLVETRGTRSPDDYNDDHKGDRVCIVAGYFKTQTTKPRKKHIHTHVGGRRRGNKATQSHARTRSDSEEDGRERREVAGWGGREVLGWGESLRAVAPRRPAPRQRNVGQSQKYATPTERACQFKVRQLSETRICSLRGLQPGRIATLQSYRRTLGVGR